MRTGLPINNNSFGTKLYHPNLSSQEVLDAMYLAAAAYSENLVELTVPTVFGNIEQWKPITDRLLTFGLDSTLLKSNLYYQASTGGTTVGAFSPGTAEAIVFENTVNGEIALAFRGTAGEGSILISGDQGDWGPFGQRDHYNSFSDLFSALDAYIIDAGVSEVLVTGHSLGGAMVEFYMEDSDNGKLPGVSYNAVAVASPQAR